MPTLYRRLAETRRPARRFHVVAGRPIAAIDAAFPERRAFLAREQRKRDAGDLLARYDWARLACDLREIGLVFAIVALLAWGGSWLAG